MATLMMLLCSAVLALVASWIGWLLATACMASGGGLAVAAARAPDVP
jgi:hypothetical protein